MDEMPDNAEIAQKDKTPVWHHLTQHKNFETSRSLYCGRRPRDDRH